jgi:hypothetical protein
VAEIDDVAEILRRAVVLFVGHGALPLQRRILSLSGASSQRLQSHLSLSETHCAAW